MYTIEKKEFGFQITLGGFIKLEEMEGWFEESIALLKDAPSEFGVFVDMRELKPLPADSQSKMEEGQKLYKQKGLVRSVVVLDNSILTMQFKRIAKKTGISQWERYIDASSCTDWQDVGVKWVMDAVDPDLVSV